MLGRALRRRLGAVAAAALAGLCAAACSGATPDAAEPAPATLDPAAIYADFAPCTPPPPAIDYDPIDGLVLPAGTVVLSVDEIGPITSVTGVVDATPVEVRDEFAEHPTVQVIHLEDEGFEAEILVDDDGRRTYLKASIRCRTGSVVAAVIADAAQAGDLPVPGQAGG